MLEYYRMRLLYGHYRKNTDIRRDYFVVLFQFVLLHDILMIRFSDKLNILHELMLVQCFSLLNSSL